MLRTPAIGDIDGDLEPEIVDSAGEHVYAWNADGTRRARASRCGSTRPSPLPQDRTRDNHIKRGFIASPALGDLERGRRRSTSWSPALDQHVYAWDGERQPAAGLPEASCATRRIPGAEIITTPALGDITGDGRPDIVTPDAGVRRQPVGARARPGGGAGRRLLATSSPTSSPTCSAAAAACTRSTRNGNVLPGWPTKPNGIVPDALPLVGPGVDHVLANVDGDPQLEVIGNVATGDVHGDQRRRRERDRRYDSEPAGGEHVDKSKVLNLFENPIVAEHRRRCPGRR